MERSLPFSGIGDSRYDEEFLSVRPRPLKPPWWLPVVVLLVAAGSVSSPAICQLALVTDQDQQSSDGAQLDEDQQSDEIAVETVARDDGRRTLKQLPKNLGFGFKGVFTKQNLKPFLIGATVTAGGFALDDVFRSALREEGDDAAQVADDYGGPIVLGALTTGLFIGGRYSNDQKFRDATYDMGIAVVVNLAYTGVLKAAISRDRPNDSGSDSFPSGHTSNAFAMATVAGHHYKGKLRTLAYAGASVIGASRMRADAHWLSDVLAGATLGILVGRGVVWMNNRPLPEGKDARRFNVAPILGEGRYGVNVAFGFR